MSVEEKYLKIVKSLILVSYLASILMAKFEITKS